MKIVVVGPGALGCLVAGFLKVNFSIRSSTFKFPITIPDKIAIISPLPI